MARQGTKRHSSLVGMVLKDYRREHHLTQAQLAQVLGIDTRTLRMYENGERALENIQDLRRIATILGIEPGLFGLAATTSDMSTPEQIEEVIDYTWSLFAEARFVEVHRVIESLLRDLSCHTGNEDPLFLRSFARAHQVAGHALIITSRTSELDSALFHFQRMESLACALHDQTSLNIALTYQGEIFRRRGDVAQALTYLEAARDTTPQAEIVERGNALQLLGRAYLQIEDQKGFEHALAAAEELAHKIDPTSVSARHSFSLGSVYDEYGKGYGKLGLLKKGMDYFDRAEACLPPTERWNMVLQAGRAELLIYCGEYKEGVQMAVEAAKAGRMHSHQRLLERLLRAQRYMDRQTYELTHLSLVLGEGLNGQIDAL